MGLCQLHLQTAGVLILSIWESKAPMSSHRDSFFSRFDLINFSVKGPHPMFSPFVVLWLVSSSNLSHCERVVFIMKGFSLPSCSLIPTPFLSPPCSAYCCWNRIARSQHWHDVISPHPDFVMYWNLFLSTSSTWGMIALCYSVSGPCLLNGNNLSKYAVEEKSE